MSTVLVVGSGGREHALAWKLSRSKRVKRVVVAPGNDGMTYERWPVDLSKGRAEFEKLAERARSEKVSLAVIGPDNPLADGIVDVFEEKSIRTFGPTAAAARIEASKSYAKELMQAADVPTAAYRCASSASEARDFLSGADWSKGGWVVKADGLALGKGVHVCADLKTALQAVSSIEQSIPQAAFVIEERLSGEELSWMAFCDGERCALLEPARDHKRIFDGDQGPNTGGMGAFSPVPGVPASWAERVRREVFLPVLAEMKKRGNPFRGLLYAGLMADFASDRFWVLEFNARFGDPETQALLPRMEDDLYLWCNAVAHKDLSGLSEQVKFSSEAAVAVVAAARGYPDTPEKGASIEGANVSAPEIFFAGVSRQNGKLAVSGGRVLAAVGMDRDFAAARARAYETIGKIHFRGMQFRKDIGGAK